MKKNRQISPERKSLYYGGMALTGVGVMLFLMAFLSVLGGGGLRDPDPFADLRREAQGLSRDSGNQGPPAIFGLAFVGVVMAGVGGFLMKVGARGVAGSGIILDPEQTRRDFEPWSRAAGGMLKDGLDEVGIDIEEVLSSKAADSNFGDKLRELHRLYEEGILSKEEYEREKREILDQI